MILLELGKENNSRISLSLFVGRVYRSSTPSFLNHVKTLTLPLENDKGEKLKLDDISQGDVAMEINQQNIQSETDNYKTEQGKINILFYQ